MKCSFSTTLLSLCALALAASPLSAQTIWTDADGDWFTPGNWSLGVPDATTNAQVNNGGTANIDSSAGTVQDLTLGLGALDSGTVAVDGFFGAASLTGRFLTIGDGGTGNLNVDGPATLASVSTVIANQTDSSGTVALDGFFGAVTWNNTNSITVGNSGNGSLTADGPVTINTVGLTIADQIGSTGMVNLDGFFGAVSLANTGSMTVGNSGNGTLTANGPVTISNTSATIADQIGSTGMVSFDNFFGAVTWTNNGSLTVGNSGNGTLQSDGGVITSTDGFIGNQTDSTGLATLNGGSWTMTGNLIVGNSGDGTLNINGASVSNVNADIANQTGSTGIVNVDGAGAMWTITGFFDIGVDGMGALNVLNGGVVSTSMEAVIGEFDGTGIATVSGTGSMWTITDVLAVGENGTGTLNVQRGGTVSDDSAVIGEFGTGTVNVDGAGSVWTTTGQLLVGEFGQGRLNITNGGHVSNDVAQIAQQTGSTGTVIVNGTGSLWNVGDNLDIGGGFTMPGGDGLLRIANGGTVNAPFTATIWTPGVLEMDGTAILNGNLTFRGGTFRSIADLTFTHSSNIMEGAVIDTAGHTATFTGPIGGAGGLTKINSGTLILPNDNTYAGGTTINAGSLAAGSLNALGTGDVTVNGGILRMFSGPRPIAVGGNYMQNSNGTLQLGVGGTDSGSESDFLVVNGLASLDGTLALVRINNFSPVIGDRVNIIGGPGGHTGMFSDVTSTFSTLLQPVPHYDDPNDVYILFELSSFDIGGLTPNQQSVANELDKVVSDPRASNLMDFFAIESLASLPHDYDLIAPEELASIYEIGFSHAAIQTLNLQHRMDDIRAGSNGFSSAGLSLALVNAYGRATDIHPDGELTADNTPSRYMQSRPDNPWGVFVTGTGQLINVGNHDFNAPGYDITTGGFTLGVDYRVCPTFAIGVDGGYAHSWADLVDDGRVTVDGGKVGVYATWFPAELYITGAFNAGWNSYDTRRAALLGDASGNTNGYELNGFLGAGYDWKIRNWTLGPVGTIQYTFVSFDGFTEDGSLAPLHFPEQDQDSIRSTVGGRLAYSWQRGNMVVRPEVRASWQREYADRAYAIDSQFASGAGDVFTVWGPRIGRDAAAVSGGISVQWNERVSTYLSYDGVLGRSNYDSHNASGGIRISF